MTKIEIKKCGSYLNTDSQGFVIPIDTSKPIQKKWEPIVSSTIDFYKDEYGENLHSVYIRGSVAKGDAVDFVSDLDSFAVKKVEAGKGPETLAEFSDEMKKRFPFCNHIEIVAIDIHETKSIPPKRTRSIIEELIKTQSRCVFGEDLSDKIEAFKLSEMKGHSLYIEKEVFEDLPNYMEEDQQEPEELKANCMWIMRRLLRGSFDLVMERENRFTRDLYCCYESVSRYYPEREANLRAVLVYALNPSGDYEEWKELVEDTCNWIVKETQK